ncbi:MAG: hypothetical protein IIA72_16390 [Proteobacteria bacterium]|nr:hypothetical protein [Pseudomonadota bacterium]
MRKPTLLVLTSIFLRLVILCMVVVISNISAATAAQEDDEAIKQMIKESCAVRWPGDYEMQLDCVRRQSSALDAITAFQKRFPKGTMGYQITQDCFLKWSMNNDFIGVNYEMWWDCTERQAEAYRALKEQ